MANDTEKLSVQLNEAFERLEKQQQRQEPNEGSPEAARGPTIEPESRSNPVNVLGTLLALIAIGVSSYAVYVSHRGGDGQPLDAMTGRLGELERNIEADRARVSDLTGQIDKITGELAQMDGVDSTMFESFQAEVDETVAAIRDQLGTSSQDWLMAEVEYLLRLGNQRVTMEGDARRAAALFRAADEIVRDAKGITAFSLREALANDIAALDAVAEVDVDGIFVRLMALANQVENLKRQRLEFRPVQPTAAVATPATSFGEKLGAAFERGLARLASLVDFRRGQQRIEPILPPEEEYYLRQNLIMKLQMAQLGLLRADQTVYADSLTEAQSWVVANFDPDDSATTAMLTSLESLEAVRIDKDLPDVSASLREVRKMMANFHQSPDRTPPQEERAESDVTEAAETPVDEPEA